MLTYKLHLIRHGFTQGNLEGRYIGSTDQPLAPEGVKSLKDILENGEYPRIERLYISPCLRCRQTGAMLYPDNQPIEVETLREYDFGVFEGKNLEQLKALYPKEYGDWIIGGPDAAPPQGETNRDFLNRITAGLDQIIQDLSQRGLHSAAVITHGGVIMTLLASLAYPKKPFSQWITENGMGYTILVTPSLWMRDRVVEAYSLIPSFYRDVDEQALYSFGLRDSVQLIEVQRREDQEWESESLF